ncbi:unnamed protein product, partial [Rotaria magnacalcarata]
MTSNTIYDSQQRL